MDRKAVLPLMLMFCNVFFIKPPLPMHHPHKLTFHQLYIKGTVSVIRRDPPDKYGNARFTTVPLKPLTGQ